MPSRRCILYNEITHLMIFQPEKYGNEVARILALEGHGQKLQPLVCGPCSNADAREALRGLDAATLFETAREPEAPMAGLLLYFSCFEEAHELVSDPRTPDGSFWHAILHRREPDGGNAAYWFRRTGQHPVFHALAIEASAILKRFPRAEFRVGHWDPCAFISFCERAIAQPGSQQERAALEIQRVEWQLLFDYTATNGSPTVRAYTLPPKRQ